MVQSSRVGRRELDKGKVGSRTGTGLGEEFSFCLFEQQFSNMAESRFLELPAALGKRTNTLAFAGML